MGGVVRLFRMGLSNFSSSLDTSKAESEAREKWLRKSSESSSRFSSHPLHSHFSLDLLQRIVAQTGTALDSGEPLVRAGDQISSSFSRLAPGRGHTLCLGSVTWCRTQGVTLEISSAAETGATMDLAAQIVSSQDCRAGERCQSGRCQRRPRRTRTG